MVFLNELTKFELCKRERKVKRKWILNFEQYDDIYAFYSAINDNWKKIINSRIPPLYQAILSYTFVIYHDIEKMKELYEKTRSLETSIYYLNFLSRKASYDEAEKIISTYGDQYKDKTKCIIIRLDLLNYLSFYYSITNFHNKAFECIKKIKELLEKEKENYPDKILIYEELLSLEIEGYFYERSLEYKKGLKIYEKTIELIKKYKVEDHYIIATIYNSYANGMRHLGMLEAKKYYRIAKEHFKLINVERGQHITEINLASVNILFGNYKEALDNLLGQLAFLQKTEDDQALIIVNNMIYQCLRSLDRMDEAEFYLNRALEISSIRDITNGELLLDASEFYAIKGDIAKAEEFVEKFNALYYDLDKKNSTNNNTTEDNTFRNSEIDIAYGFIELKKMNLYKAKMFLSRGVEIAKRKNYTILIIQGFLYLIELLTIKLQISHETERKSIIHELKIISEETAAMLNSYHSYYQWVNYSILLSYVYFLIDEYKMAIDILEKARVVSLQRNYTHYLNQIQQLKSQINTVYKLKETGNETTKEELLYILNNKMHKLSTKGLQAYTPMLTRYKEEGQLRSLFVFKTKTGEAIFSYDFEDRTTELSYKENNELIGLISTIEKFGEEIKYEENPESKSKFSVINYADYYIMIQENKQYSIALLSKVFNYDLKNKIKEFDTKTRTIFKQYTTSDIKKQINKEKGNNKFDSLQTYESKEKSFYYKLNEIVTEIFK